MSWAGWNSITGGICYPASSRVTYLHPPGLQLSIHISEPLVPLSTQLLAQGDVVSESGTLEPDSGIGYRDAQQAACSLAAMDAAVPALRQAMAAAPLDLQVTLGRVPCRTCCIKSVSRACVAASQQVRDAERSVLWLLLMKSTIPCRAGALYPSIP